MPKTFSKELTEQTAPRPQAETWAGGFLNSIMDQLKGSQMEDPTLGLTFGAPVAAASVGHGLRKIVPKSNVARRLVQEAHASGDFGDETLDALELLARVKPEELGQLDRIYSVPGPQGLFGRIKEYISGSASPSGVLQNMKGPAGKGPTPVARMGIQESSSLPEQINTAFHEVAGHVPQVNEMGSWRTFVKKYNDDMKKLGGGNEGYYHPDFWYEREAEKAGKGAEDALTKMVRSLGMDETKFRLDQKAAEQAGVKLRKLKMDPVK